VFDGPSARRRLFLFFYLWPAVLVAASGPSMSDSVLLAAMRLVDRGTWTLTDGQEPEIVFQTLAFDISVFRGEVNSGVGPGATAIAVPFYVLLRPALVWFDDEVVASKRILNYYLANSRALGVPPSPHFKGLYVLHIFLVLGLIAPLYAAFLTRFRDLALEGGASPAQATALAIALGMGSMTLFYSSMYSRQALAYLLLWNAILPFARSEEPRGRTCAIAGGLAGAAIAIDYGAAVLVGLFLPVAVLRLARASTVAFLLPLAGVVGLVLLYHDASFGSPLSTPYHHRFWKTPPALAERGIDLAAFQEGPSLGVNRPDIGVMFQLSFGRFKGLFLYSPILGLGLLGHLLALRASRDRGLHAFCLAVFVSYLILNSTLGTHVGEHGRQFWGGLSTLWGPRYLFAVQPFLAWGLVALPWSRVPVRAAALLLLSVSCLWNVAATMFSQVIMSAFAFGPELDSPLTYVLSLLFRSGPRLSLLDAYGVSPIAQGGAFGLLVAISAWILMSAVRTPGAPGGASGRPPEL
jgi:hypothetical protein